MAMMAIFGFLMWLVAYAARLTKNEGVQFIFWAIGSVLMFFGLSWGFWAFVGKLVLIGVAFAIIAKPRGETAGSPAQ